MGTTMGGTVTLLFTDIEGSTRRWERHGDAMSAVLARHDALLSDAIEGASGLIFKHTGDGMAAAFARPGDAVRAAVAIQRAIAGEQWTDVEGLSVRVALHTGEVEQRDGDYYGPTLNRAARVLAVAHGGQVLASSSTVALVDGADGVSFLDLGTHRLKDLERPERLYQLVAEGLARNFPPLASLDAYRHNLPIQRTSFVGREDEVAELSGRLVGLRLLTLTGVGGCGKTRLALQVAGALVDAFPDGVFFVDLSSVTDPSLLPSAVSHALGARRALAAGETEDDVLAYLATRRTLLVLDNCEHLVDDCAAFVDAVLDRCEAAVVLATSREPLSVEGEHVWRVRPLAADRGDTVRLFAERAGAADQRFRLEDHSDAVEEVCRRLDGIPLAIEMAAAQVAHLTPEQIAARLDDRLQLLTGGRRRVPRQQTLEATLDWSFGLLSEPERRLLTRLGVFTGTFELKSATAVCADDGTPARDVLGHLSSLVAKSLVTVEDRGDQVRYRLLETVRLYALSRLDPDELATLRGRHADHYVALVEAAVAANEEISDASISVANYVASHLPNVRAALEWVNADGRLDTVARLATGATALWWSYGLLQEGARWLQAGLAAPGIDEETRARSLYGLALVEMMAFAGDFTRLAALCAEAAAVAETALTRARALTRCGFFTGISDVDGSLRLDEGLQLLDEAEAVASAHGLSRVVPTTYAQRGWVQVAGGRYEEAARSFMAALSLPGADVDNINVGAAMHSVVHALHLAGRHADAADWARRIPPLAEGNFWGRYHEFLPQAYAAIGLGDLHTARDRLVAAAERVRHDPVPVAPNECLIAFGALAAREGDDERAWRLLKTAVVHDRGPFRTSDAAALYVHYARMVKARTTPDTRVRARAAALASSVAEQLDLEVARARERLGSRQPHDA